MLVIEFFVYSLSFNIFEPVLSDESAVNLTEHVFYMINYFFLPAFRILTFSLAFDSLTIMCLSFSLSYFGVC